MAFMGNQVMDYLLAGLLRLLLMFSSYQQIISNRVEVSTALNSWKRITEGVYLQDNGIDPYSGDLFHETPLTLCFFKYVQKMLPLKFIWVVFILVDLTTAFVLGLIASNYISELIIKDKNKLKENSDGDQKSTAITLAHMDTAAYIPAAYLFNPYIVLNCVGLTTTVFTNLIISLALLAMLKQSVILSSALIAFLTMQGLYPICLLVPMGIYAVKYNFKDEWLQITSKILIVFFCTLGILNYISYNIAGSWSYLRNTIGFIIMVPDLRPNIGLYWYFFTEMFEHFRLLFIASFQINVGLLYIVPLALRLRQDPMLLAFSYLAIMAIFKSYPSIGDVGFYMSLLPMWRHLFRHMQQGFIVGCFILFCTVFAPTVWHQWIYSQSANANFYFGVTLAFAIAQIFLLTDILFAGVKREFALKHGLANQINGKKAKLLLE